ncbi:MAG: hypothetical protein SF097_27895 [Acidobacteriota bacterium]|nr:hypothetical protein [Acidobacteriota bacterium]
MMKIAKGRNGLVRLGIAMAVFFCAFANTKLFSKELQTVEILLATKIRLPHPTRLTIDTGNNLWVKTGLNDQLWVIDLDTGNVIMGGVERKIMTASHGGDAIKPKLITQLCLGQKGEILFADILGRIFAVREISKPILHISGTGQYDHSGDGGIGINASFRSIGGLAVDKSGNIYIADTNSHRVKRIDSSTNTITTFAGSGNRGFDGDGGLATSAKLNFPNTISIDNSDNIFIADTENNCVRRVDASTKIISTVAGSNECYCRGDGLCESGGDGKLADKACIAKPTVITIDSLNNLYIAEAGMHRVRLVDATTGIIVTIAGTGEQGFSADGKIATDAKLNSPSGLAIDKFGHLYISDWGNNRIIKVDAKTKVVTTVAGNGLP